MNIEKFISENAVDQSKSLIDVGMLERAQEKVGVRFGEGLVEYLLKYGYLGFEYVELYGINSRQGLDSDMVKQTLYLHKYFPKTIPFIAIENQGDGTYYLVDSEDKVYEYDSGLKQLKNTKLTLFEYILQRFKTAKG